MNVKNNEGVIMTVNLRDLQTDSDYQREVKPHAHNIGRDFNPAAAGTLMVGKRPDGSLWLIDGRQRVFAMLMNEITRWRAVVISSGGAKFEAAVYNLLNGGKTRKSLTAVELFKARLTAEDPTALATKRAVEAAGLRIKATAGGSRGFPEIVCVGALYRETGKCGEATVVMALQDMIAAWPMCDDTMIDIIPIGMIKLYHRFQGEIDRGRMIRQLATVPARKVLQDSMVSFTNRYFACQKALLELYNKVPKAPKLKLKGQEEGSEAS